ncbi:HAD family hydrolase [Clostridium cellulovorans]|uniref:HAD family hydrolase n=1 Tax=Clostridium cellulovorans TaxID=1493 RepID=UPI0001A96CDA|nr:HAD family hydrolase [Clostridium cellulovorans]
MINGGNFLEALNHVEKVVSDKTGTLTKGVFRVTDIKSISNITNEEIHKYTATAESLSNHHIATSIINPYKDIINKESIESYEEIAGYGVKAVIDGKNFLCGNNKLMKKASIDFVEEAIGTIIYTAIDSTFSGSIKISDKIKEDSKKTIDD